MGDIPDSHMAFARALIALAREHGMDNLKVEFDHSGARDWQLPWRDSKTHFRWEQGRHEAKTSIFMSREESVKFEEVEPLTKGRSNG